MYIHNKQQHTAGSGEYTRGVNIMTLIAIAAIGAGAATAFSAITIYANFG